MGVCYKVRFPCPMASTLEVGGSQRVYESCQGGLCSRSGSPGRVRPPLWEPKPFSRNCSPTRPQTAPSMSVSTNFYPQPDYEHSQLPERPTSARSSTSYDSCKYSNCSRSPCESPRALDESVYPYQKPRALSPPGWPYSPKRVTRRGRWWDKDWQMTDRYHYRNPDLQPCGCHKSRVHSGSRTPSPPRSPRAIGREYHFNRLAAATQRSKSSSPKQGQVRRRPCRRRDEGFEGFGHRHKYENWSCSSSRVQSRSGSPRCPSPPGCTFQDCLPTGAAAVATAVRSQAPAKARPLSRRGVYEPGTVNSHGHRHTYRAWSCTPSKENSPKNQSPLRSRDPTPPPPPRIGGTTTIQVSYSPPPAGDSADDVKGLRPAGVQQHHQVAAEPCGSSDMVTSSCGHPFMSYCHSHHCHHSCRSCGHHGHHGQTLFTLNPSPAFSCGCGYSIEGHDQRGHCHHHHHCHCFHHHHHHHH